MILLRVYSMFCVCDRVRCGYFRFLVRGGRDCFVLKVAMVIFVVCGVLGWVIEC